MKEAYQRHLKTARLRFFSDALLLKALCGPDSLRDLENIRKSLGIQRRRGKEYYGLVNGYKLVVATPLYSLLDHIINFPSLVGLDIDYRLTEWWGYGKDAEGIPTRSAFTFPDSPLANLVVSLNDILMQLPKSDTWQSFQDIMGNIHTLGETLYESALGSSVSWLKEEFEDLDTVEALRRGAIERVDDYLETGILSAARQFTWEHGNSKENSTSEILEDFWQETESHLDPPPFSLPRRRQRAGNWGNGIWAATSVALIRLRLEGSEDIDAPVLFRTCTDSPGQLKAHLHGTLVDNWPSLEYGLNEPPGIPLDRLINVEEPVSNIHPENRLRALVGNEEGRILSSYPTDAFDFPKLLEAATSSLEGENRIEVVRVKHPAPDFNSLTWYSLAIRVSRFGLYTNASKWWVFYKAHGYGPDADSEVYVAERLINESLAKLADRIDLIELEYVGEQFFLNLFEPLAWRKVFNNVRGLVAENSELRGTVPELLATDLLSRRGYRSIRTSFKPKVLGGLELDSLGIRSGPDSGECLVIETKRQSTTDRELVQEIEQFTSKVRTLKGHLPELAQEVGYEGEVNSVSGIFVSMGRPDIEYVDPDVTFWDFDGFIGELRKAEVPRRLRDLLQPTRVYHLIEDLTTDAWFKANDWTEDLEIEEPMEGE